MSFKSKIDKRRQTYVRMLGEIAHALNQALDEEHERRGLTQADIARTLGKQKSFVSRKLSGDTNMTLETLADLAYALDRPVRVSLPSRQPAEGGNFWRRIRIGSGEARVTPLDTREQPVVGPAFSHRPFWSVNPVKVPEHA